MGGRKTSHNLQCHSVSFINVTSRKIQMHFPEKAAVLPLFPSFPFFQFRIAH